MDFIKCSVQDASFQAPSYARSVHAKCRSRVSALLVTVGLLGVFALVLALTSTGTRHGSVAGGGTDSASAFDGAALPLSRPPSGFTLSDQNGRTVSLSSLRGHPVVLAFLYPGCGASCVLIAQQIRGALGELKRPVAVVIVDAGAAPASRAARRSFLKEVSLSGRALYLTGSTGALGRIWRAYSVTPAGAGAAKFTVNAEVRLLDRAGRERVLFGLEQLSPEALAHDIGVLERGAPGGG